MPQFLPCGLPSRNFAILGFLTTTFTYSQITANKRAIWSEPKLKKNLGVRPVELELVPYSEGSYAF